MPCLPPYAVRHAAAHAIDPSPPARPRTRVLHHALRRAHQHVERPLQLRALAAHVAAAVDEAGAELGGVGQRLGDAQDLLGGRQ